MTHKTTMPETVAVVRPAFDLYWAGSEPIISLVRRTNVKVGSQLITTDQAEAYADARVREALEEAERMRAALQRIAAMDSMSYHSLDSAKITANEALEKTE